MARLTYTVEVSTDNPESDYYYLCRVRETFRMITEILGNYGYTDDESFSQSDVSQ